MDNKVIFWCEKCNLAYGGEAGIAKKCPECQIPLTETEISREEWRKLSDFDKDSLKEQWKKDCERKKQQIEKEKSRLLQEQMILNQKVYEHMITSGYNFEGYRIKKYLGIVCGECVLGTGFSSSLNASFADFLGIESSSYNNKLQSARKLAESRAIMQSISKGGNALIGVDIDYVNFSADVIGVIYNGTSVVVEKID